MKIMENLNCGFRSIFRRDKSITPLNGIYQHKSELEDNRRNNVTDMKFLMKVKFWTMGINPIIYYVLFSKFNSLGNKRT